MSPSERLYWTNNNQSKALAFPADNGTTADIDLSVVVPCFNETTRLGSMLGEAVPVLQRGFGPRKWEILIVDDGSTDGTANWALDWAQNQSLESGLLKVVKLEKNRGKGGAVAHGMLLASGKHVLFADADGASRFADVKKLLSKSHEYPVVVGSRAHMVASDVIVKRSVIRNLLMLCLHLLLWVFGVRRVKDTQCGFKLFSRSAARAIFAQLHTSGWIFDVEVLVLAEKLGLDIAEVAISWHEVTGSKIALATDSLMMAVDLVVMRMAFWFGIYSFHKHKVE